MPEVSLTDWNHFLQSHPDAHLLQTGEWGELKSAFGWEAVRVVNGDVGVQILFRRLPLGLAIGYIPKLAVSGQQSAVSDEFWKELDDVCKKQRAVFLKIEADEWEDSSLTPLAHSLRSEHSPQMRSIWGEMEGGQVSMHNIQPPRTIVVDLRGTEDEILARMKQKCRYNIRLAEKKGVSVRAWDDIEAFHKMMLITGGRDEFGVHSLDYYRRAYELFHPTGMCELLVAEFEGKPLAALMVFARGKRAWYVYGASNDEERNRMPTYLLQWEAMRWVRAKGAEEYDLWGVPDEDEATLEAQFETRSDGLWGVYRFKRGFGGELKRAEQAVDRVYNPFLYKLYLWRMAGRESS
ncbi:MAG TPA: peptidoglycan bridge formation glycyltransferase FemA/FemB family protein [Anaerolineales bacterium]|nr:peptidoglycan bridge formation glycyltransferase FemA/FemB family protein [Anaerolineales bacterium]